jgi:shikimate dehydrogenase
MQNAALEALGLRDEWHYEPIDVAPEDFEQQVRAMPGEGFVGANVTIPHKEAALALADAPSRTALEIGAANTLVFANGEIAADNTDAFGLLSALKERRVGPSGVRVLVLGAGGAARAVIWALAKRGAVVYVWNRHEGRARQTYDQLGQHLDLGGAPVESPKQENYGIIVNTTSVGLHGEDPSECLPIDPDKLGEHVVVDLAYGDGPTKLIQATREAGATTIDGIDILVHQGARSLEVWTGKQAPIDVMREAAEEGLSR